MQVGKPFLTYYDGDDRTELSYATFDNWVAKTANWLRDERDVGPGDTVGLDRADHWLSVVLAFAAWRVGAAVGDGATIAVEDVADEALVHPDRFEGGHDLPAAEPDARRRLVTGDVVGAALAAYRGSGSIVFGTIHDPERVAEVERAER